MNKVLILSSDSLLKYENTVVLSEAGFKVETASDLDEGLQRIDKESFDIIIIDEQFPNMDDYLTCQHIHNRSDTPIILLGSGAGEDVWNRVDELGFDFYLKKPFNPRELVARIKAILRRARPKEEMAGVPGESEVSEVSGATITPLINVGATPLEVTTPEIIPSQPAFSSDESPVKIWQDVKVAKLIDSLITGQLSEISPEIDLSFEDGFSYPEADKILETSGKKTAAILESLVSEDILHKRPFAKILLSPGESPEIVPVACCPYCYSSNIAIGQLVEEHSAGERERPEQDLKEELEYTCPKCKKELKLISPDNSDVKKYYVCYNCDQTFAATEYGFYLCHNCHRSFPVIATKFLYLKTGESYTRDKLKESWVNAYYFNEAKRDWLEFELNLKALFISFLKRCGYQIEQSAKVSDKAGAIKTVDILAIRRDIAINHIIGIDICIAKSSEMEIAVEELLDFATKVSDVGIHEKVVIAIPKLSYTAKKFAETLNIIVYEPKDLRVLSLGSP